FPRIVESIRRVLNNPTSEAFAEVIRLAGEAGRSSGDEMLIRQLIRQLPRQLGQRAPDHEEKELLLDRSALLHWQTAQRDGLAMGFTGDLADSIAEAMKAMPGLSGDTNDTMRRFVGRRWHDAGLRATDTAVLLVCSLPYSS